MSHRVTIHVHYPLAAPAPAPAAAPGAASTLALRTEADWDLDVEAAATGDGGTRRDFELELTAPFLYFKPVLRRGGEVVWSRGENYLALADERRELSVYPHFFADVGCSVCRVTHLPPRRSARRHALRVFLPGGYEENTRARYPVLYMQDGQNLFFAGEAFAGQPWRIEETRRLLDSMSVVGSRSEL